MESVAPHGGWRLQLGRQHPPHGRRTEMESGSRQHRSDPSRSHRRAERLEAPHQIADEVGEATHRLADLDERIRPFLVEAVRPGGDGLLGDEQASRGFRTGPASGRSKLEDREPFDRRVMRSALRGHAVHSRVLDPELFTKESDLLAEAVILGLEPDTGVEVILGVGPPQS